MQTVFQEPQRWEADGTFVRPHRVNPETGQYRGRQVMDVEV